MQKWWSKHNSKSAKAYKNRSIMYKCWQAKMSQKWRNKSERFLHMCGHVCYISKYKAVINLYILHCVYKQKVFVACWGCSLYVLITWRLQEPIQLSSTALVLSLPLYQVNERIDVGSAWFGSKMEKKPLPWGLILIPASTITLQGNPSTWNCNTTVLLIKNTLRCIKSPVI